MSEFKPHDELYSVLQEIETSRAELERCKADLGDLKRLESERLFLGAVVEGSSDSIITVDLEGVITSWNAAAERLYGYAAAEALHRPLAMLTLPTDLAEVLSRTEQIKQRKRVETYDAVRIHKGGEEMWLSVTLSPVMNRRGELIGVSTIARDLTAGEVSKHGLQGTEARLRTLADAVPQIIWTNNGEGIADYFNQRWYDYTGLTFEESVGPGWQAIVHPEDAAASKERWQAA
ncbi:MAG TPA: PAS domain S-box protein, partial [Chthoniobacteraceae bacterium]